MPRASRASCFWETTPPEKIQVYAKLGHNRDVLLLAAADKPQLAKSLFDLRDKDVLDFILNDVSRIELTRGEKSLALLRKKRGSVSKWEFADGVEASSEEVESLLSRFHTLKAAGFVDKGFDLAKLGLAPAKGVLKLTLTDQGKTKSVGLLLGGALEGGKGVYLRRASGGPVFKAAPSAGEPWAKTRFDLTERRLFRLDRKNIDSLEIMRGGKKLAFAKTGTEWRRTEPKGKEQDGMAGSMFTWELADLKWQKILTAEKGLLAKPRAVISFSLQTASSGVAQKAQGKKHVLTIGEKDPETGLLAAKTDGSDRVYGIKTEFWDKMPVYPRAK